MPDEIENMRIDDQETARFHGGADSGYRSPGISGSRKADRRTGKNRVPAAGGWPGMADEIENIRNADLEMARFHRTAGDGPLAIWVHRDGR